MRKILCILCVALCTILSSCTVDKKNPKPIKQQSPELNQDDYNSLAEAIEEEMRVNMVTEYDSEGDIEYEMLKTRPDYTTTWYLYPNITISSNKFTLGISHYDDIINIFGEPNAEYEHAGMLNINYDGVEFEFYKFENYRVNSVLVGVYVDDISLVDEVKGVNLSSLKKGATSVEDNGDALVFDTEDFYAEIGYIENDKIKSIKVTDRAYIRKISEILQEKE
jgi:hypothetical protein